jgi:hypothetical protein
MGKTYNSVVALVRYFAKDARPVERWEWMAFWMPLSSSERDYYRHVDLTTGLIDKGDEHG